MSEEQAQTESGQYKKVASLVREWLEIHKGEQFDLDTICRQTNILERDNRKFVAIELSRKVQQGKLDKYNKIYRYIDNTIKSIDWVNAKESELLDITFPHGHEEDTNEGINTFFGFDKSVVVSPGDIIIIAGVSNMGKTCYCLNLLWDNMDKYPCTLMGNEYTPLKFKRRTSRMKWAEPLKEGIPKFELIERRDNWKDIIRPDNINIIDWINLPENAYMIANVIDGIQSKLRKGIGVLSIQKKEGSDLGTGGQYSEHLASLYLNIDFERLTVRKCKEWNGHNPNHEMYGFEIVEGGTQFRNIRKVRKCPKCYGRSSYGGSKCEVCASKGFINSERSEV